MQNSKNDIILELVEGGKHTYVTLKKAKITIGREEACDVILNDDGASKKHCTLEYSKNTFWLVDLNSKNGTYVNQTPIKRTSFYMEDIIQIGESFIRFASKKMSLATCQKLRKPGKKPGFNKSITFIQSSSEKVQKNLIKENHHHGAKELTGIELSKKFRSPGKAIEKITKKKKS